MSWTHPLAAAIGAIAVIALGLLARRRPWKVDVTIRQPKEHSDDDPR